MTEEKKTFYNMHFKSGCICKSSTSKKYTTIKVTEKANPDIS